MQHKKADLQAHRALSMARLKEEKLDSGFLQLSDPQGIMNKIGTAVEPKKQQILSLPVLMPVRMRIEVNYLECEGFSALLR